MTEEEIEKYFLSLFEIRNSGVVVERKEINEKDLKLLPKQCHDNVIAYCKKYDKCEQVMGWLYFDLGLLPYVKFVAHSVVRDEEGNLFDITPIEKGKTPSLYPFIESINQKQFEFVVSNAGYYEIDYYA